MKANKLISPSVPPHRRISLTAGFLYLLTFVSIPTLVLYSDVKSANYITGPGPDTAAITGGLLEIIVALSCIASAVVLYPILKKQSETLALGLVAARILEAGTIFVGVAFLLTIVSLRQSDAGAETLTVGHTLATLYDRIFLLGQSFMPAINDLLLGILLYRSRLIPRAIPLIGMVGAITLLVGFVAVLFGAVEQRAPLAGASALLVALFEFILGIWLVTKGFNPKSVLQLESKK